LGKVRKQAIEQPCAMRSLTTTLQFFESGNAREAAQ
jgi:hypothetical protein